jgi:hypothetical protein
VEYIPARGWYWESSNRLEDRTAIGNLTSDKYRERVEVNFFDRDAFRNALVIDLSDFFLENAIFHNLLLFIKESNSSVPITATFGILICIFG